MKKKSKIKTPVVFADDINSKNKDFYEGIQNEFCCAVRSCAEIKKCSTCIFNLDNVQLFKDTIQQSLINSTLVKNEKRN